MGNFLTPSSWTPSRTTPTVNDVLVFDGNVQATPIVNNIRTQQIGSLIIINGANVNFASAVLDTQTFEIKEATANVKAIGYNTYFLSQLRTNDILYNTNDTLNNIFVDSIYNDTIISIQYNNYFYQNKEFKLFPKLVIKQKSSIIPSLVIDSNSKLQFNCNSTFLTIFIDSGVFANINGTIEFNSLIPFNIVDRGLVNRIIGIDTSSIIVKNGGKIIANNGADLHLFGAFGNKNIVQFDSGSFYQTFYSGSLISNKFGTIKTIFKNGSNFILYKGTLHRGINYGNVHLRRNEIFVLSNSGNSILTNKTTIENLTIDSGMFIIQELSLNEENSLNITGNLTVSSSASVNLGTLWNGSNGTININFNGKKLQNINGAGTINVYSTNNSPVNIKVNNIYGLQLNRNFNLGNSKLFLDTGAINLNGNTLTIGEDSLKFGNLKASKGYITGNGSITKWYPSNKAVTNNLDSTLFPFGTNSQNRNFWVLGNATKAGTITISHNNLLGYTRFTSPFFDSVNTNIINARQNYHWNISAINGLKGNNFTIKAIGNMDSVYSNLPANIRLTLANNKAPGIALSGIGTASQPLAARTNLTDSNLNNTFYLGAYSTACSPPSSPLVSNKTICENTNTNLSSVGIGTLSWYSDSVGGNYLGSGLSFNTPTLTNTTNYFIQDSTCAASTRTKVTVFILPKPKIGFTINNISQCINNNSFVFTDTSTINQGNMVRLFKINNTDTSSNISFTKKFNIVGNYTVQLIVANSLNNNCKDSITKAFNIKPKPFVTTSVNATIICEGQSITLYGNGAKTYSWSDGVTNGFAFYPLISKTYSVIGNDSNNCADTTTINITVNKKPTISASASVNPVCAKQPIILTGIGGETYYWSDGITNGVPFVPNVSKTYLLTALDLKGCSDTATINVQILPLPNIIITKNKTIITATQTGALYQWINCNTVKSVIVGATNQSYTATFNGDYAVIVTQNGCSDTSICVNINSVGLSENSIQNKISIFPNPANAKLTVTSQTTIKEIYIYDLLGKLVKQINVENNKTKETEIAIDDLSAGIYFIKVIDVYDAKLNSKFIKE